MQCCPTKRGVERAREWQRAAGGEWRAGRLAGRRRLGVVVAARTPTTGARKQMRACPAAARGRMYPERAMQWADRGHWQRFLSGANKGDERYFHDSGSSQTQPLPSHPSPLAPSHRASQSLVTVPTQARRTSNTSAASEQQSLPPIHSTWSSLPIIESSPVPTTTSQRAHRRDSLHPPQLSDALRPSRPLAHRPVSSQPAAHSVRAACSLAAPPSSRSAAPSHYLLPVAQLEA